MQRLQTQSLLPITVEGAEVLPIDPDTLLIGGEGCYEEVNLAFIKGTAPDRYAACAGGGQR